MKKLFILFFSLAVLVSCSSDDDNTGEDPILGTWFLAEFNNPIEPDASLSDCEKQSFITFNADNTAYTESYSTVDGECVEADSDTGDWENQGGSVYEFTIPGFGTQSGHVEFVGANRFIFTNPALPGFEVVFEK